MGTPPASSGAWLSVSWRPLAASPYRALPAQLSSFDADPGLHRLGSAMVDLVEVLELAPSVDLCPHVDFLVSKSLLQVCPMHLTVIVFLLRSGRRLAGRTMMSSFR